MYPDTLSLYDKNKKYSKICVCEYDGTNYAGWQYQPDEPSIQEELEKALKSLYDEDMRILGAGRTDAGVHALGQVFHYYTDKYRKDRSIVRALNSLLPEDISILSASDAPKNFHPIASAKSKTYRYRIINRYCRSAIEIKRAWHCPQSINTDKLTDILNQLKGKHDFSAFCAVKSLKDNNIRTINSINVIKDLDTIDIFINADGFLHNMMRSIVGTAVHLCNKDKNKEDMKEILMAKDRTKAFRTAPAHGLYLMEVFY